MAEITHKLDRETGHYVQIVSPERLRAILKSDGDTLEKPTDFGESDQWETA
jgi:hypothetical protein